MNTTRALKFLESYGKRQTKLWKVLSKYEKLPDHFHDLQTTLQTEFNFLKKATSKTSKIYTMLLISNKPILHLSVAMLTPSIQNWHSWTNSQTHCLYPHFQTDSVQINAPEYNSNIDGQMNTLPDIQPQVMSHAENTKEGSAPVIANSEEYPTLSQDADRFESQSESAQNPAAYSLHQDAEQSREQYQNSQRSQLEDIPELEDEDWEDRQFTNADLIDYHNTMTESD